jgi:hypothetical protein
MSQHDQHSFMPPDEPTAVYPIGASNEAAKKAPPAASAEPPEPPALPTDIEPVPSSPSSSPQPLIILALLGVPLLLAVGIVVVVALVLL